MWLWAFSESCFINVLILRGESVRLNEMCPSPSHVHDPMRHIADVASEYAADAHLLSRSSSHWSFLHMQRLQGVSPHLMLCLFSTAHHSFILCLWICLWYFSPSVLPLLTWKGKIFQPLKVVWLGHDPWSNADQIKRIQSTVRRLQRLLL